MREKLAFFVDTEKLSGGAYHELVYMIDRIHEKHKDKIEIVIISTSKNLEIKFKNQSFKTYFISMNSFERHIAFLRNYDPTVRRMKKYFFFKNKFEKLLKKINVDLVYFTGPSQYSLYLEKTDFIITIPDVSHRENLEFPEWTKSDTSEFHRREEIISKSSIKAIAVITNAEIIKEKISYFYKVSKERIYIINHQPSLEISNFKKPDLSVSKEVKTKYNLPHKYIFYPAMYLPHKNHKYIIDTIKIINAKKNFNLSAVFCGSDKGYLNKIKKYTSDEGLSDKIYFLGYVDDIHLPYIYLNSLALTMPTFSGPTNIPPWEAFKMEIPVFYSNLEKIKNVYKEAVYYIDPFEPKSLAEGLIKIINSNEERIKLTTNGKNLLNSIDGNKEFNQIFEIIQKRQTIKSTWKFNN
tara:strand:- start:451 stop:1677 length:1227 start_codon:yes stop_codon:yes gene_type:complete